MEGKVVIENKKKRDCKNLAAPSGVRKQQVLGVRIPGMSGTAMRHFTGPVATG